MGDDICQRSARTGLELGTTTFRGEASALTTTPLEAQGLLSFNTYVGVKEK